VNGQFGRTHIWWDCYSSPSGGVGTQLMAQVYRPAQRLYGRLRQESGIRVYQ